MALIQDYHRRFFFTDKEAAQINAIANVFRINASLCMWHMMRAVKKKLAECRKQNLSSLTMTDETKLMSLMHTHYSRSTVLFDRTDNELRALALAELHKFFEGKEESVFIEYMLKNWYDESHWRLWGRRSGRKVALSRTTMFVESHWSVLNCLYLLPYNRPRVDLVVYIIDTRLMPKFENDFDSLEKGIKNRLGGDHLQLNGKSVLVQRSMVCTTPIMACSRAAARHGCEASSSFVSILSTKGDVHNTKTSQLDVYLHS